MFKKNFFEEHPNQIREGISQSHTHTGLGNKSAFNPKGRSHRFIEVFKDLVQEDIKDIPFTRKRKVKQTREAIQVW